MIQARPALSLVQATPGPRAVRVLIADGLELVRAGFSALLDADEGIAVVGEAGTGDEAVARAARLAPDVVIVDADLPGLDPVGVTTRAVEVGAATMLLAGSDRDERVFAALRAGARGVLTKDAPPHELVRAVKALAGGDALLSPSLTRRLIAELASRPGQYVPRPNALDGLTAREREVVQLVALGLSNDEIAERLVVSRATAKTHVSRAMVKLDAHDRAKLVVIAYETGLATSP